MRYLALLRGINVGGNNLISMTELRRCFEDIGLQNVATYIQSGNVLFQTSARDRTRLAAKIESALTQRFGYTALIGLVSEDQLASVVQDAPEDFGSDPGKCRYDVIFLRPPVQAREVLPTLRLKEGVDEAFASDHVLYCSRLISKASQSHFPKLISHPAYKSMTIRNWNTTSRLRKLMQE
ncbi:MAG: DUF1697 domain-containing protein [Bryobacteraceae bacterium]